MPLYGNPGPNDPRCLFVRAYCNDDRFSSDEVDEDGRLISTIIESELVVDAYPKEVGIVAYDDCKWYVHLSLEEVKPYWKVWVSGCTPILRLQWDPRCRVVVWA